MRSYLFRLAAIGLALIGSTANAPAQVAPVVLAAASLQESLTEVAGRWAAKGDPKPVISFAASSILARQIAAGAPADLFISADEPWMDDLAKRGLIAPGTRARLVGNMLVLVAPVGSAKPVDLRNRRALAAMLAAGPIAMADPDAVPAGKYGKAALQALGVWDAAAPHVVRAENVRAALALVERGAAPLGIVYATDARAAKSVRVVAMFPANSHPPITYPIARLKRSTTLESEAFRRYLLSGEARRIFMRYGFTSG